MSGIAAIYGQSDPEAASRMLSRLAHRGPDNEGSLQIGPHWLGYRGLGIAEDDRAGLRMVGNGTVANHDALRSRLNGASTAAGMGIDVVMQLFDSHGPNAFDQMHGAFAFVVAGEDGRFVAARDAVGVKPLYWARRGDEVRFASEMKSFDSSWQANVQVFPPGHYWTSETDLVQFADAVPQGTKRPDHVNGAREPGARIPESVLNQVRDQLVASVERELESDEPVGVFLSGGLDSTLVAAIAARWYQRRGERLQTFAVGSADSPDLAAARSAADYLGTEHHERIYSDQDALRVLPEVVRVIEHYDPSLVRSSVANFLLAEFASDHVKVVLTGEGADEIFAGYEYLRDIDDDDALHTELIALVQGMHNLGLQRGDRVTMAHGIEGRLPFLDHDMIELGLSLAPGWKLAGDGQPEKRLLRLAFDGWLPEDLLWRKKAQFGDGSGAADTIQQLVAARVTEEELQREKGFADPPLRTREELVYFRMFRDAYEGIQPRETISLFATA